MTEKLNSTMTRLQSLAAMLRIIHGVLYGVSEDQETTDALYGVIALLDDTTQDLDATIAAHRAEG